VHPNPSEIERPYDLEGFSLFFGMLRGQFGEWQESGLPNTEIPWLLKYPQEKENGEGEDRPTRYVWAEVTDQNGLKRSAIYAVNPLLAQYDAEIGFRFAPGGGFQSPFQRTKAVGTGRDQQRGYSRESYQEHIQKMLTVYQARLSREMTYAATRLEQHMGLEAGALDRAVRLAIAFHDIGKMDRRWQGWAHEWQERIGVPVADDLMLAHTDYNPDDPRHQSVEAGMPGSRPPHAAEGAVAVLRVLHQLLGTPGPDDPRFKLMKAVFSAIARHHSPQTDSYQGFSLHPTSKAAIAQVLGPLGASGEASQALEMSKLPQPITGLLVQPDARDELLAYFLIVRALRLADQEAMAVNE
jgi:CRISPR-associated endonuclease/helicase Cas3